MKALAAYARSPAMTWYIWVLPMMLAPGYQAPSYCMIVASDVRDSHSGLYAKLSRPAKRLAQKAGMVLF